MIKLNEIEKVMKPQFVFDKDANKFFQCDEEYEGNKDLARSIFVGISDMYGFDAQLVMSYLDMGYDSYRYKLSQFREYYREGKRRQENGTIYMSDDAVKKYFIKVSLCMNAIKFHSRSNPYLKLDEYVNL
jgi:hypothetical protein